MSQFIIALVGRPNVGKSRMFNRISETENKAIVYDYEGVTRDRQYSPGEWYNKFYTVIDTGGFVPKSEGTILRQMRMQAQLAIDEADAIIFMMDGRAGLLDGDRDIANMLRQTQKPVFYVVNKIDSEKRSAELLADFYELGEDLYPLSAEHGLGTDGVMDAVAAIIPADEEEEEAPPFARVAFVGKPNAGKSSLINSLLGTERLLVSDTPGTTRDSIDSHIRSGEREYTLIDTAGLRRKKNISEELEHYSVVQAIRSIDRADVALMIIDAQEGVTSQDKKIAGVIANRGRACVIIINKWDLIEKDTHSVDEYKKELYREMPFMHWAPVIFVSALTKKRVHKILELVDMVFERYTKRVTTSEVNRFLEMAIALHSPPVAGNRRLKFYFAAQVAVRPPAFVYMVNHPESIPSSYKRFLENRLRETFDFEGTPVRTMMRARRRNEHF